MASRDLKQPNILFILTDDQGSWALGCAGNNEMVTPNLDQLAASGIRFENFFCTSPVCSPARASILTGRIPSQHGVHDFIKEGNSGSGGINYLEGQIAYTDILAEHGYICGISGKWHLGASDLPQNGFSHWYVHQKGSGHYYNAPMYREGKLIHETAYITDVITDDALAFLDKQSKNSQPFYLSVHYTAPHDPWTEGEHPQELLEQYKDCQFLSCPQGEYHSEAVYQYEKQDVRHCLQGYFSAVTGIDMNVGRLMKKLDDLNLREDTLVVFTSDNGFNCGHHGIWGKGNGTFNLNMFDTSIKVPFIISQPGKLPKEKVYDQMYSHYDLFPTLLDYTGLSWTEDQNLPGQSFLPCLLGKEDEGRENVFVYDEYGPVRMVRSKQWKYVHRYPYGKHELYDLVNDPEEMYNLYDEQTHNEIIFAMRFTMEKWFLSYTDPNMDGIKLPVRGNGQTSLVGIQSNGKQAFDIHRKMQTTPVPLHLKE